uniref:Uncharacterized protein n=1 Tax=Spumella elongata TaxID=89044 RepID=A0A7S3HN76_9STRA
MNPAGGANSSNGGAKKFNKNSASKVLQEQVTRGMCREALIKALGKYIAYSVKLPDLGQKHKRGNSGLVLGDLEEALVPYYASASKQDYYCRLWI